ncbi:MAG: hypothetical protein QME64_06745 [bacterium]|nr:hypothetical protein [bacterium]
MVKITVPKDKFIDAFFAQLASNPNPENAFEQAMHHLGLEYLIKVEKLVLSGLPLGSMQVSGQYREYIYVTRNGKTYIKRYAIPANPRTEKQQAHRIRFGQIAKSWSSLPPEMQEQYNQLAKEQPKNGFNLYIEDQFQT